MDCVFKIIIIIILENFLFTSCQLPPVNWGLKPTSYYTLNIIT